MDFDTGIRPKKREIRRYDFTKVRNGHSAHVATHIDRIAIMGAFNKWKAENSSPLTARSEKVGKDDPRGPGYRVFFLNEAKVAKEQIIDPPARDFSDGDVDTLERTPEAI